MSDGSSTGPGVPEAVSDGGWRSRGASQQGLARAENQDSLVDLEPAGVFAVADGMGGHHDGGFASRTVTAALAGIADGSSSLELQTALVEEAMASANAALRQHAEGLSGHAIVGSTVVVLVVRDGRAVGLWAGDSRIYLRRGDALVQLTQDHVATGSGALTRAVGGAHSLALDRFLIAVLPGDTFLLCSDGLTKGLTDGEIARLLTEPLPGLPERLIARAVVNGSTDDTTVLVVRCGAEPVAGRGMQ